MDLCQEEFFQLSSAMDEIEEHGVIHKVVLTQVQIAQASLPSHFLSQSQLFCTYSRQAIEPVAVSQAEFGRPATP